MTLIEAQTRFITRVREAHPGHRNRVHRSAWKQLHTWAEKRGYDGRVVCKDAKDMLVLEELADE